MFRDIGAPEILLILAVLVLLFGAKKLPDLARGSGRALRIFKAETKGLVSDDDDDSVTPEQREINARNDAPGPGVAPAEGTVEPKPQPQAETQHRNTAD